MKLFPAILGCALALSPAAAEELPADDGRSLMSRGLELFLDGMSRELGSVQDEMQRLGEALSPKLRAFAEEMGPALEQLLGEIDDVTAYEPPEMLPNGDIIMRRKVPLPPDPPAPLPDALPEEIEI